MDVVNQLLCTTQGYNSWGYVIYFYKMRIAIAPMINPYKPLYNEQDR